MPLGCSGISGEASISLLSLPPATDLDKAPFFPAICGTDGRGKRASGEVDDGRNDGLRRGGVAGAFTAFLFCATGVTGIETDRRVDCEARLKLAATIAIPLLTASSFKSRWV